MRKEYKNLTEIKRLPLLSEQGESSVVYKDKDTVIKLYNPKLLNLEKNVGLDTERKILTARPIIELPEQCIPTTAIYDDKTEKFIASRVQYIEGTSYRSNFPINSTDLTSLCNFHIELENFLKRADKYKIVLPDYGTIDNLIIDENGNFHFIDYDGIQIKRNRSFAVSSNIRSSLIDTKKYIDSERYFTPELNIFSHIVTFFIAVMHANPLVIGQEINGEIITFDDFFEFTGLDDADIQHKIWKLFQQGEKNEYLGEDINRISEIYNLEIVNKHPNGLIEKMLIRK